MNLKSIVMCTFFVCANINAMNSVPGHILNGVGESISLVPCKKDDLKKGKKVIIQWGNDWKWGQIVSIVDDTYIVKDSKNSGKAYSLSRLYQIKKKLK